MLDEENNSSSLVSRSEHHFCDTFSASVSLRQKSAPPTTSGGSRHNQTRTVYNLLIAYRDVICTEEVPTDNGYKVCTSNSDFSLFYQEWDRTVCPRSRPSTTSTVSSDTNCMSRETSQTSVRNRCSQRSRNSRIRHHQQESISDVEEDEVGKVSSNRDTKVCLQWLQNCSQPAAKMKTVPVGSGTTPEQNYGTRTLKGNMVVVYSQMKYVPN